MKGPQADCIYCDSSLYVIKDTLFMVMFQMKAGNSLRIRTAAVLSSMDTTIGRCVGNSLEVMESLETLKGHGPEDLMELVTTLGKNSVC